jgi:putative endonuclease
LSLRGALFCDAANQVSTLLSMTLQEISMEKQPAIYIMANKRNGTLYTGVTSDLIKRAYQHKNGESPGFSRRYNCKLLVYYEVHEDMLVAIAREKQIKAGSRKKKIALIESMNPQWVDLYAGIL